MSKMQEMQRLLKPATDENGSPVLQSAYDRLKEIEATLRAIGDFAHDRSTGPAIPDALWEIREMAYQHK